ncbi:hypothetical protein KNP414_07285 [Paenibacillus mucilaginosus KNP414]|nr:hypothetical protein KNP414_07285 [Paenibacillus mucilaginosus KNP414]
MIQPHLVRVIFLRKARPNDDPKVKEVVKMEPTKNVEIEQKHVERRMDSGMVASTFIKYAAYIVIFFGFLYFLVRYVFPMF